MLCQSAHDCSRASPVRIFDYGGGAGPNRPPRSNGPDAADQIGLEYILPDWLEVFQVRLLIRRWPDLANGWAGQDAELPEDE